MSRQYNKSNRGVLASYLQGAATVLVLAPQPASKEIISDRIDELQSRMAKMISQRVDGSRVRTTLFTSSLLQNKDNSISQDWKAIGDDMRVAIDPASENFDLGNR